MTAPTIAFIKPGNGWRRLATHGGHRTPAQPGATDYMSDDTKTLKLDLTLVGNSDRSVGIPDFSYRIKCEVDVMSEEANDFTEQFKEFLNEFFDGKTHDTAELERQNRSELAAEKFAAFQELLSDYAGAGINYRARAKDALDKFLQEAIK